MSTQTDNTPQAIRRNLCVVEPIGSMILAMSFMVGAFTTGIIAWKGGSDWWWIAFIFLFMLSFGTGEMMSEAQKSFSKSEFHRITEFAWANNASATTVAGLVTSASIVFLVIFANTVLAAFVVAASVFAITFAICLFCIAMLAPLSR